MTDHKQVMQQALDALELAIRQHDVVWSTPTPEFSNAITALRAALAEQPKPMGWWNGKETVWFEHELNGHKPPEDATVPIYTAPQPKVEQQGPDLSGLRPATQEAIRGWLKDGTFVERIIRTQIEQEKELMRYEAQTAQREPLTETELNNIHQTGVFWRFVDYDYFEEIARAVEEAHNIT